MEDNNADKKNFFEDPYCTFEDEGERLVSDYGVGFFRSKNKLTVDKDHYAHLLRLAVKFAIQRRKYKYWNTALEKESKKLIKQFKKRIKAYMNLDWGDSNDSYWDFVHKDFIAFTLGSKMYEEYLRIDEAIQEASEMDGEAAERWLLHEIEYPGETAEE